MGRPLEATCIGLLGVQPPGGSGLSEPVPPDERRRRLIKHIVLGAGVAGAAAAGAAITGGILPRAPDPAVSGRFVVTFSESEARSAWHNHLAGYPMRVGLFPGPGWGAQGRIPALEMDVVVVYLEMDDVHPEMRGVVPPGFAAFNATCTHLPCTSLWRNAEETADLVPVQATHDVVVCPCHVGTFDPYNRGWVTYGPPPRPLEQLRLEIEDGLIHVVLDRYEFGGGTPQV